MAGFLGWGCQLPPNDVVFLKFICIAYFFVLPSLLTIPIGRSFILATKGDKRALLFFLYFSHTWAGESRPCQSLTNCIWRCLRQWASKKTPFECLRLDSGLSADAERDAMGLCEERCKKMCLFRKRITCRRSESQNRLGFKPKDTAQSDTKLRQPFFPYLHLSYVRTTISRGNYKVLEVVQDSCYNQNSSKHYFQKTWFRKKGH